MRPQYLHTYIGGKKKENHLEILKRYLEWGMSPTCSIKEDPNATLSRPLLHYMMDPLGVKSLKLLLNEGADMMCLNSFKSTALGSAILNRDSMGIAIFSGAMRPKQIAKMIAPVNAARPSEPPRDSRLRRLWRWLSPRARKGYAEEYARYIAKERDFNAPLEDEFGDGFPGLEPGEDIADGTRRVPLVMLMEQNEEAAIKAMDGMMYVQLGYERPGQPIQVNCDFAKVHDSRGSSLRDDIITPYELAVTKRMVNISAHPVMTLLTVSLGLDPQLA